MKIAIQGGRASFHDIAARNYFNQDISVIQCESFKKLCEVLQAGEADFAVMAIENSIAGSILSNYTFIRNYNFYIIGEIQLRIEQNLIALPGIKAEDIKIVRSHYMALLQCQEFLDKHPHILLEEYHDTADSARDIKKNQEKTVAAIAGRYAAELYGMNIIAEGIETEKMNYTRFMILSTDRKTKIEEANKATLSFQLPNRVGALADVLRMVVENNINLTKIQSIPILGKPNEYTFYVDCEWESGDFKNAVSINSIVRDLTILGEYKKGRMIHDYSKGTKA
jgi:prephenate dehydratase